MPWHANGVDAIKPTVGLTSAPASCPIRTRRNSRSSWGQWPSGSRAERSSRAAPSTVAIRRRLAPGGCRERARLVPQTSHRLHSVVDLTGLQGARLVDPRGLNGFGDVRNRRPVLDAFEEAVQACRKRRVRYLHLDFWGPRGAGLPSRRRR